MRRNSRCKFPSRSIPRVVGYSEVIVGRGGKVLVSRVTGHLPYRYAICSIRALIPPLVHLVTTSPVVSSTLRDILGKSRAVYPQQGWGTYLNERMTSLADLTLWLLTILVEAFVVYLFLIQRL